MFLEKDPFAAMSSYPFFPLCELYFTLLVYMV